MKTTRNSLRPLPAALLLATLAFGFTAHAQTATVPPAETAVSPGSTQPGAGKRAVERTKRTARRAGNATKRGAKKVVNGTENVAERAGGAVRRTGERIGDKLPPAPRDQGLNGVGQPRVPAN
ncbi:hypothetical protein [Xylophilus ampelinus]|uniref:Uncharacterized protein n=1 Tax=Xylophilus ampelinus TaxID=54067 RepID=A0A318SK96_9BURK|nr:hypothetical protein [Xylophilus ampelinus]MCS4508863.1 hypothetical protein [Xylophilus ampelinus]PYE79434.1 hypothetical protein DFQ15_102167 [Xylophilus ampelinus]